jgi:hypothetical protein
MGRRECRSASVSDPLGGIVDPNILSGSGSHVGFIRALLGHASSSTCTPFVEARVRRAPWSVHAPDARS